MANNGETRVELSLGMTPVSIYFNSIVFRKDRFDVDKRLNQANLMLIPMQIKNIQPRILRKGV